MTIEEYNKYYDKVIEPLMKNLVERNNNSDKKRFVIAMRDSKESIYEEYQNQKTIFRLICDKPVPKSKDDTHLHRHKVCACLTVAIIKSHPLYAVEGFPDDKEFVLSKSPSVNEQLAFSAGLSLLRTYILADDTEGERKKYFEGKDFFIPESFKPYDNSQPSGILMVWSLYEANVLNNLSTPLLADIYFLLERYHELYSKFNEKKSSEKQGS